MKVIILDDSKEDRDIIHHYLSKYNNNIDIQLSKNFKEAEILLKENNFDAIFLDLNLPKSEGIETVKKMQEILNNYNKNTSIIVLTGIHNYKIGKQSLKLGASDFLIKDENNYNDINRALNFATYSNHLPDRKQTLENIPF